MLASELNITITDDERTSNSFMFKIAHPQDASLFLSVGIEVSEAVVISITSPIIVPEEKMDMM